MKTILLVPVFLTVLLLSSCGQYGDNLEKGKKAKCKLEELQNQLVADPSRESELRLEINQNTDFIKFYREESGNPEKFDQDLNSHKCS